MTDSVTCETMNHRLILSCERIIADMPMAPRIQHQGDQAYYNSLVDYVNMPGLKFFDSPEAYYATLLHELVHSTGHEKRLNRPELVELSSFGSHTFTKEELTAEIVRFILKLRGWNIERSAV